MRPVWQDPSRTSEERVAALMRDMTLEEKVAQLGGAWPGFSLRGEASEGSSGEVSPFQDSFEEVPWEQARVRGVGHLTRPYGTAPISVGDGARKLVGMQRDLMTETRLGVPAIAHEECLTGFTTFGATIYPAPLALAATFDPDLVESVAARIGSDLHRAGIHQGLSPVLDVVRDYRWGRVEETMGEDPYLCSVAGAAYVRGLEGEGVVATLKHFVGYSASRAARNHAPVSMGRRELLDVMLPPFEAAIREGGARSVMNSYTDIDGVPVAADETLLTGLLRESVGFRGVVVSDYWAVSLLANVHRVAAGEAEAGALALRAGIDVELPIARAYAAGLVDLVRVGGLDEAIVDRALERVLTMKLELGLLDDGYDPAATVDPDLDLDSEANRLVAARAAEQAVVLLKNADLLPLTAAPRTIAVIGPAADEARSFLGCYSYPNHVLHRFPDVGIGVAAPTLLDAVRAEFPGSTVLHSAGCDFRGSDATGIDAAFEVASAADLVIVAVGDIAGLFGTGTSGEGCDAPDLTLPGVQDELLDRLLDAGTPTIVVCVSGRPYALGRHEGRAQAILQAFMPGQAAAAAITGILSGRVNPSGRLPVQVPALPFGQPSTYLQPLYGQPQLAASSLSAPVLYPFGHGLTFTTFRYSEFRCSADQIPTDGRVSVSVTVTNTGNRPGAEVVQLYLSDPVAEVARPTSMLIGFARVPLQPGESATVAFDVSTDRLAYHGRRGERIVDAGDIGLSVGRSVRDIEFETTVAVTGQTRSVGFDRELLTATSVTRGADVNLPEQHRGAASSLPTA